MSNVHYANKTMESLLSSHKRKMRSKLVLEAIAYCCAFGLLVALWVVEPEFRVALVILACSVGYIYWAFRFPRTDDHETGATRQMRLSYGRTVGLVGTGLFLFNAIWFVAGFVEMTRVAEVILIWIGILLSGCLWLFAERFSALIFRESSRFSNSCICCELKLKENSGYQCPACDFKSSGKTVSGLQKHFYKTHPEFSLINVFGGVCEACKRLNMASESQEFRNASHKT